MRRKSITLAATACVLALVMAAEQPAAGGKANSRDGRYRGMLVADNTVDGGPVFFTVTQRGRRVRGWRVTMNVVCATYPAGTELITQTMPAMKVASNGRFRRVFHGPVEGVKARIMVSGRLVGRRVVGGKIEYSVSFRSGTCRRTAEWSAQRRA